MQQLRPCFRDMCILFKVIRRSSLNTVRKKFSLDRYKRVADIEMNF